MRTTLSLDDDVYEAAKALADSSGKSLGKVVSELARKGMAAGARYGRHEKGTLPVFEVSDSARVIPGTRADELLADEGVE